MKRRLVLCLFLFAGFFLNAEEQPDDRLQTLLSGWLSNDLELQKSALNARSKALSRDSAKISSGITVELSSGNVTITTGTDDSTRITVNPKAEISIPQASGASAGVSIPVTVEDGKKTVDGGSITASIDIISSSGTERSVKLLQAQRALTEAERTVEKRALEAEKEFYSNLKKLYKYAMDVRSAKNDLYDDELELKVLETKSYSKTSAKYRQASLKVETDRREIKEIQHQMERETAIFALKCGVEYDRDSSAADDFLPASIPSVKIERIFDYDPETYTKTESALWNKEIGSLERKADSTVSVKASGEYKFNSSVSGQDDAGGKLTLGFKGLDLSAGAYYPTGTSVFESKSNAAAKNDNPYFQFSLGIKPEEWRLANIKDEQKKIDQELEEIAIKDARDAYDEEVLSKVSQLHDIKWSQKSYNEEYKMYTDLERDMEKWLKEGIVTESDWLDAKNNREKAHCNIMINSIDQIIYNNEVKLMFIGDKVKKEGR